MSTNRIRGIVLLMALGLLGLVGFQAYWISNALRLAREQFGYKVTDALQAVVRSLERQEIQYQGRQRLAAQQQQRQILALGKGTDMAPLVTFPARKSGGTVRRQAKKTTRQPNPQLPFPAYDGMPGMLTIQMDALQPIRRPLTPEQLRTVDEFYRQQDELMAAGDLEALLVQQERFNHWSDQVVAGHLTEALQSSNGVDVPDSVVGPARSTLPSRRAAPRVLPRAPAPQPETASTDQAETIKAIFRGVLMADRPLEERVNRYMLDTLLRQALRERGISLPFEYAVKGPQENRLLFASAGLAQTMPLSAVRQLVEAATYKAVLFPNNLLETDNYLYLLFPDQQAYILRRMTATLVGSALLILVIMGCFYVAIRTILRQKKMADIKNDFINNMTHEFKTPISTIALAVEMAREQLATAGTLELVSVGGTNVPAPDQTERLRRYMGIVGDENQRLGSHVEKVLQMALLDKGAVKLALTPVNVHDVIERVLNAMSLAIEQRGGEVDLAFNATHETVLADEVHLTNMLHNLLDNAVKYSPDRVAIQISTANTVLPSGKPAVQITVADAGLGLSAEQRERIFETFYRVPTGNRHDVKGFGLGLSYVKKMAEAHQGLISVTSTPGKGSEFKLTIPAPTAP